MAVQVRKPKHHAKSTLRKLPYDLSKQLTKIYFQSSKGLKKWPFKTSTNILLSVGLASGILFLVRYLKNK